MRLATFITVILWAAIANAAPPGIELLLDEPPPKAPSTLPQELKLALDALAKDSQVLADASLRVAALQSATVDLAAAQAAIVADQKKLAAMLDALIHPPQPIVPDSTTARVEVLVISSPTCAPCKLMEPDLLALVAEGQRFRVIDQTSDEAKRLGFAATPTLIALVDGRDVQRVQGRVSREELRKWYEKLRDYARGTKEPGK